MPTRSGCRTTTHASTAKADPRAPERRDNGILLITIAEPKGFPAATLTRGPTEFSCTWLDFADSPTVAQCGTNVSAPRVRFRGADA